MRAAPDQEAGERLGHPERHGRQGPLGRVAALLIGPDPEPARVPAVHVAAAPVDRVALDRLTLEGSPSAVQSASVPVSKPRLSGRPCASVGTVPASPDWHSADRPPPATAMEESPEQRPCRTTESASCKIPTGNGWPQQTAHPPPESGGLENHDDRQKCRPHPNGWTAGLDKSRIRHSRGWRKGGGRTTKDELDAAD